MIPAEDPHSAEITAIFDLIKAEADHSSHGFADMMRARLMEALVSISRVLEIKTESD